LSLSSSNYLMSMPTEHYHILIHFKRPIKNSRGSTKFDLDWAKLKDILDKYENCREFDLEEGTIHPLNVSRISVCRTKDKSTAYISHPGKKSEMYNLLEVNADKNEKYEYDTRQKKKNTNENTGNMFIKSNAIAKPECRCKDKIKAWKERFKRSAWLIAPFGAAIVAYSAAIYLFHGEHAEPFLAAITVALGLQYFKENLPTY
jgi:hypothetical protein